ncbi:hypothetical protein Fcan01_10672 [Folsomia candida]|uniref:Uncharacterized protein n=1 Tax=Folsomia candida TaxID=158441 RepID=A0A226E9R6_FOLCA|nr:hypothetical protein Fcan01_10672 [Folsomia candida]
MRTLSFPNLNFVELITSFVFMAVISLQEAHTSLNSVLEIFSHCTLIVKFTTNKTNFIPLHPILIHVEDFGKLVPERYSGNPAKFLFKNVSFTRRLQQPKFCWSYIFPDMGDNFLLPNLINSPIFPRILGSTYPVHLIWIISPDHEKATKEMETIYEKILSMREDIISLGSRELYFVQPCLNETNVQFYHLNRYHHPNATLYTQIFPKFQKFTKIMCNLTFKIECFQSIENITDKIALAFNKFSWIYINWLDLTHFSYNFSQEFVNMQEKYFRHGQILNWIKVANQSESLDDFVAYTIFSETLFNMTIPSEIIFKNVYLFFGRRRYGNVVNSHQVVITGSRSYNFLSCYGINKENSYKVFTDPFDVYIWVFILTTVLILTMISAMTMSNRDQQSNIDVFIITVAVMLEISFPSTIKKVISSKIKYLFWLWVCCCVILTSVYKDGFTTEVMLPYKRTPSWKYIYDLEEQGFQFFLPLKPDVKQFYDSYSSGRLLYKFIAFEFSDETTTAASYTENLPRLLGYKKFAESLLGPTWRENLYDGKNTTQNWKVLHYKWPSHVYPNLSRCDEKLAYVDEKGNIKDIIPYLNDNKDGRVFMSGTDDDFFLTQYAIKIDPIPRGNFVLNRVKYLMVSGIYDWWEGWFKRTRPKKLFPYYANWTGPNVGALEKLDFGSKFLTTLRIWGVCCAICGVVWVMEFVEIK